MTEDQVPALQLIQSLCESDAKELDQVPALHTTQLAKESEAAKMDQVPTLHIKQVDRIEAVKMDE